MAYKECTYCNGSGLEYQPQTESCPSCGGNGKSYGYGGTCTRCGGTGNISTTNSVRCSVCHGSGTSYIHETVQTNNSKNKNSNKKKNNSNTNNRKTIKKTNNNTYSVQGFIGLFGFIAGGAFGYYWSNENLIVAAIAAFIVAYLGYKYYQTIIIVAIIIGIIYLFIENN